MKPRPIPFELCVAPISNEPNVMRWRLDFADWLAANGHKKRADFVRVSCAVSDARRPLAVSFPDYWVNNFPLPWYFPLKTILTSDHDWAIGLRQRWNACCPEYWQPIEGVWAEHFFGRLILRVSPNEDGTTAHVGKTEWLPRAYAEGWLETIYLSPRNEKQVEELLDWPESARSLPIMVNTHHTYEDEFGSRLMRRILMLPGLRALNMSSKEVAIGCMKQFGETARNLRYLQLHNLRNSGPPNRLLAQLGELPELRVLYLTGERLADAQLAALSSIKKLHTLMLWSYDITDEGLRAIAAVSSLRALDICSPRITRDGVYALREARPELLVHVSGETREVMGPV
jgi:uncharacterized protein (TIGR02996 family)